MHRTQVLLSTLALFLSAGGALGCSASSTPAAGSGTVSFKTDVLPLFWTGGNTTVNDGSSCTLTTSCHGQMNAGELNFFLGDGSTTPASDVRSMLVGVKSVEDPSMDFVKAGDPANSYILYKMKGTQGSLANDCKQSTVTCSNCTADMPCGVAMPYNGSALPDDYIKVVSDWITQGALDN